MTSGPERKKVTISAGEYEFEVPRRRNVLLVEPRDWKRIRRMIECLPKQVNWLDRAASVCLAWFVTALVYGLKCPPEHVAVSRIVSLFLVILGFLFFFFGYRERKTFIYRKDEIQKEMDQIELDVVEKEKTSPEKADYSEHLETWIATDKPGVRQGVDYKEIPLHRKKLKGLGFVATSLDAYWRAGFKLEPVPSDFPIPILVNERSLLCHLAHEEDGNLRLTVYLDGRLHGQKPLALPDTQTVRVDTEVEEDGYLNISVDGSLVYRIALNEEILERAFLAAWADGREYKVKFSSIGYTSYYV